MQLNISILFQETDLDSNPPTEGTWDYDHMDVSVNAENEIQETRSSNIDDKASKPSSTLSKESSEDREVAKFTGKNADLLNTPLDSTSESGESNNRFPGDEEEPPTNRFVIGN